MRIILPLITALLLLSSCQKKLPQGYEPGDEYFSIQNFLDDQWKLKGGQPFVLERKIILNGQSDSSLVPLDSALWTNVRAIFDKTDISDPKYLSRYAFTLLEDKATAVTTLLYQAKEKKLFTRKVMVGMDSYTHKLKSVYIETESNNWIHTKTQKLSYITNRSIQIIEFEKSIASPKKELLLRYSFP